MAENKKDSFTFSDKIKNSKPAFNPFSKRISSKIGGNGKPKKTLFERTRRDAPFFVAAAAALLMLPFLYKYSGSVNEEVIVPPGSEDSVFDPERFGFEPSAEDPSGQIAQLTGRDPLSLIKGWGSPEEEESAGSYEDFRVQDGLNDNYNPPAASSSPRSYAPAATRAAFRRQSQPTKIKELGSASMNLRGGGGQGFRFGGANLKAAARKDSSGGPRQGAKPVSLQPLRAADKPARSYFGQGGAAQARASRDAMGKANALTALKDAMFSPVKSGGVGGLGSGEFAPGGGGGQINHTLDYKGITPWWWDMMKERSQKAWEWKYFLWKKNLVEPLVKALGEVLATFGKNLACCFISGNSDCDADTFAGGSSEVSKEPTCCGKKYKKIGSTVERETGLKWGKEACDNFKSKLELQGGSCPGGWEDGHSFDRPLNFFQVRAKCMGFTISNRNQGAAELEDRFNCAALDTTHNFSLQAKGKAGGWHKYHAIVAKNYVPFDNDGSHYLCGGGDRNVNPQSGASLDNIPTGAAARGALHRASSVRNNSDYDNDGIYNRNTSAPSGHDVSAGYRSEGLVRDDVNDACVIYVAEGGILDWDNFKSKTVDMLTEMKLKNSKGEAISGEEAFGALNLYFVEGYAFKHKMSKGSNKANKRTGNKGTVKVKNMPVDELPLKYVDFEEYYILHRNNSSQDKETFSDRERVFASDSYDGVDGKERMALSGDGKEDAIRTQCSFATFRIAAKAIDTPQSIEADLSYEPETHGATAGGIKVTLDIPEAGLSNLTPQKVSSEKGKAHYVFTPAEDQAGKLNQAAQSGGFTAKWKADYRNKLSTDEASYGGSEVAVEEPTAPEKQCEPGEVDSIGKIEGCDYVRKCGEDGTWGAPEKVDPNCGAASGGDDGEGDDAGGDAGGRIPPRRAVPPQQPTVVSFLPRIGLITGDITDVIGRKLQSVASGKTPVYGQCASLESVEGKKLLAVDEDIQALLKKAKEKYEAANANSTLTYDAQSVSVANLLDAMDIVQTDIPLNAVCMLGKTIGASAQYKSGNKTYNGNMFGAFAAYIGVDSSFYPHLMKKVAGGPNVVNERFQGCLSGKEVRGNKRFHYGHYNWNHKALGDQGRVQNDRAPFEAELRSGQWAGSPLAPIANAVGFARNRAWDTSKGRVGVNDSMDRQNREKYHAAYKNVFQKNTSCGLSGTAKMNYDGVKRYIKSLCDNGASNMPTNGNGVACNRRYLADTQGY